MDENDLVNGLIGMCPGKSVSKQKVNRYDDEVPTVETDCGR